MLGVVRGTLGTVILMSLVACGGGDEPSGAGGQGDPGTGGALASGGASAGGTNGDGGASPSGGSGTGGSGGTPGSGGGSEGDKLAGPQPTNDPDFVLSVSNYEFGQPKLSTWRRYKDEALATEANCQTIVEGGCALFVCGPGGFDGLADPNGFGEHRVAGGTGRVSYEKDGTTFSAQLETTPQGPSTDDANVQPAEGTLFGGELLTFTLSGDDIPALSRSFPFPERIITTTAGTVTETSLAITAERDQALLLSWEGGAPGVLYKVSGGDPLLFCEFDSTLGEAEIPASLLGMVSSGTALSTVTASAWRGNVDGYDLSFAAGAETYSPEGQRVWIDVQ